MQLQKKLCDTFKVRCEKCIVNIAEMKSPYMYREVRSERSMISHCAMEPTNSLPPKAV